MPSATRTRKAVPRAQQTPTATRPTRTSSRSAQSARRALTGNVTVDVDMSDSEDGDSEEDPLAMTPLPARTQRRSRITRTIERASSDAVSVSATSTSSASRLKSRSRTQTRLRARNSGVSQDEGGVLPTQDPKSARAGGIGGRKRRAVPAQGQRTRSGIDLIVGGVEMDQGDLVPPSDEEEFDAWAADRGARRRRDQEELPSPSSLSPPHDSQEQDDSQDMPRVGKRDGTVDTQVTGVTADTDVFVTSAATVTRSLAEGERFGTFGAVTRESESSPELFELGPTQTLPPSPAYANERAVTPPRSKSPHHSPVPSSPVRNQTSHVPTLMPSPISQPLDDIPSDQRNELRTPTRPTARTALAQSANALTKTYSVPERSPQFTGTPKRRCLQTRSDNRIDSPTPGARSHSPLPHHSPNDLMPMITDGFSSPVHTPPALQLSAPSLLPSLPPSLPPSFTELSNHTRAFPATPEAQRPRSSSILFGNDSPLSEPPDSPPTRRRNGSGTPVDLHQDRTPTNTRSQHPLPIPEPVIPIVEVIDPALAQFRSARSFRTRTTLQLQPYTRERQIYEAALRRGGLKSTKSVVAPVPEVRREQEEHGSSERARSEEEEDSDVDPERIVIQPSSEAGPTVIRKRILHPVLEVDRDQFEVDHGRSPDEDEDDDERELQRIVRVRRKEEKEEKRRERENRRMANELRRAAREHGREEREKQQQARAALKATPGVTKYGARRPVVRENDSSPNDAGPMEQADPAPKPSTPAWRSALRKFFADQSSPIDSSPVAAIQPDYEESVQFLPQPPSASAPRQSESSEEDTEEHHDTRERIARRMLPAAMLRRLEREAALKELDKMERRRRDDVAISPARPGKAVRRKGEGVNLAEFGNLFDDSAEESDDEPVVQNGRSPSPDHMGVIEISDDSDGSQAEEVNYAQETLARLYEGDFESIAVGRAPQATPRKRKHGPRSARKNRRPVMRIDVRPASRVGGMGRNMVQSRLDFAERAKPDGAERPTKASASHKTTRRPARDAMRPKPRPVIKLDDRVIFEQADFAFEEEADPTPSVHAPATKRAATSRAPATEGHEIDNGVGKARSWAHFEHFSVDFEIAPLPTGLYCAADTIAGDGLLANLVDFLKGEAMDDPLGCTVYGITFDSGMSASELALVWPSYTSSLLGAMGRTDLELGGLEFLSSFLSTERLDLDTVASVIRQSMMDLAATLDADISFKRDKPALYARWWVLDISIRLAHVLPTEDNVAHARDSTIALLCRLLVIGFDRAVRPLKLILRGESISGKITDDLTIAWISVVSAVQAWKSDWVDTMLFPAMEKTFALDNYGPIAAERVWFLAFGLSAMSQFDANGKVDGAYQASPRWNMVRHAISLIKLSHSEEAEERAHAELLKGRDRYIRIIMARCVRLSSAWRWHFDRDSFTVATRDLGVVFKNRQHRNFPTEPPVDYPSWITQFDITRTADDSTKRETAFELYLRLVCVAASDIVGAAQSLSEAQQAEKDIQRLIMSIIPVSSVRFNRISPPTARQVGQLINRYSTMIAACYFSPGILPWLLMNSQHWAPFEKADFQSRQLSIRGLMYLAIACRHHDQPLEPVVARLAGILKVLQTELDRGNANASAAAGTVPPSDVGALEVHRTMVLVISCFRQIILHHSFEPTLQATPVYPNPVLLHEGWTARIFDLSVGDHQSGLEIVRTIQSFLDVRLTALPSKAQRARDERVESQDEFGSLGFDLDSVTVAHLGGPVPEESPPETQDQAFAQILLDIISPRIYRLLSNLLPAVMDEGQMEQQHTSQRNLLVDRLAKCWVDCAAVLVIDHRLLDWSTFITPYGAQSFSRLAEETGRARVGLVFSLNVLRLDPTAFTKYPDEFCALFFGVVCLDKFTIEHEYVLALLCTPAAGAHPILKGADEVCDWRGRRVERDEFMQLRGGLMDVIFRNMASLFADSTPGGGGGGVGGSAAGRKSFLYRCVNLLVTAMERCTKDIPPERVIHRESYRLFTEEVVLSLRGYLGRYVNEMVVPSLKAFPVV